MVLRFAVELPDGAPAMERGGALLARYGFRPAGSGRHVRGSRWGSVLGIHPRGALTTVSLHQDRAVVYAEMTTDPWRGPLSELDRHLFRGEMDDLEAAVRGGPGPGLDRARENRAAGLFYLCAVLLAMLTGVSVVFWTDSPYGVIAGFAVVILFLAAAFLVPFRMTRYPLADAPTDLSNYPR